MSSGAVAASRKSNRRRMRLCMRLSIFDLPVSHKAFSCLFAKHLIMSTCKPISDTCQQITYDAIIAQFLQSSENGQTSAMKGVPDSIEFGAEFSSLKISLLEFPYLHSEIEHRFAAKIDADRLCTHLHSRPEPRSPTRPPRRTGL